MYLTTLSPVLCSKLLPSCAWIMATASKQVKLHLFFLSTAIWGNKVKCSDGKLGPLLKILQMEEFPKVRATVSVTWPLLPPLLLFFYLSKVSWLLFFHLSLVSRLLFFHLSMVSWLPIFHLSLVSRLLFFTLSMVSWLLFFHLSMVSWLLFFHLSMISWLLFFHLSMVWWLPFFYLSIVLWLLLKGTSDCFLTMKWTFLILGLFFSALAWNIGAQDFSYKKIWPAW